MTKFFLFYFLTENFLYNFSIHLFIIILINWRQIQEKLNKMMKVTQILLLELIGQE